MSESVESVWLFSVVSAESVVSSVESVVSVDFCVSWILHPFNKFAF